MNCGFHSEHFSRSGPPKTSGQGQYDLRFTLKPFDEIKLSTVPNYLIKGIIPRTGLVVIWGAAKCGKSFWIFDLMMHVALGRPYRGRRVQQGAVVYLALEGGYGFRARVDAWRQRHLANHRDPVPFYLLDVPVDLIADHRRLIAAIKAQFGSQIIPAAVVIDTLNRALIGDENKSDDMAKFIRASDMIRQAFGCVVPIVHHCGVAGSRPRGHTSLSGADDAQIAIERDKADNIIAKIEHMKDGEAGATIVSRLDRVELGEDDDGDPITSRVIVPAEARPVGSKLPGDSKLALDVLEKLIAKQGKKAPTGDPNFPAGIRVCPANVWRETFYKARLGDKPDANQKAFVRAAKRLQRDDFIGVWDDLVWQKVGHSQTFAKMSGETAQTGQPGHTPKGVSGCPGVLSGSERPEEEPAADPLPLREIGPADADAVCVQCRSADLPIWKIKPAKSGAKPESLHRECAPHWFNAMQQNEGLEPRGGRNPRNRA